MDGIIKVAIVATHHYIYNDSDSSDSENIWGGSRLGRTCNIQRDFAEAN